MILGGRSVLGPALQLGLAFLLALPLGYEREHHAHSAGLRSYPLLAACVCGFLLLAQGAGGGATMNADVFFGLMSGIGFVGSGAIVKSPERARGMSTAVSLWVTGAIGAGVAMGAPLTSAALSLMTLVTLVASPRKRRRS